MILVKANAVIFETTDGKLVRMPRSYGLIHDHEGHQLPKCETFYGPYKVIAGKAEESSSARWWFGRTYEKSPVRIDGLRVNGPWRPVASVQKIYYVRKGTRAPGGFHHPFKSRPLELSKCGKFYRLSLPGGCVVMDDRGFIFP